MIHCCGETKKLRRFDSVRFEPVRRQKAEPKASVEILILVHKLDLVGVFTGLLVLLYVMSERQVPCPNNFLLVNFGPWSPSWSAEHPSCWWVVGCPKMLEIVYQSGTNSQELIVFTVAVELGGAELVTELLARWKGGVLHLADELVVRLHVADMLVVSLAVADKLLLRVFYSPAYPSLLLCVAKTPKHRSSTLLLATRRVCVSLFLNVCVCVCVHVYMHVRNEKLGPTAVCSGILPMFSHLSNHTCCLPPLAPTLPTSRQSLIQCLK